MLEHFLALTQEDRYLRFGGYRGDNGIESYVQGIDLASDVVYGTSDDGLALTGVAHLARCERHAELGLSVLPGERGRGLGRALLRRSCVQARNWGVPALYMQCLAENAAMIGLARSLGMQISFETGDAGARLELPPPDAWSFAAATLASCHAQVDCLYQVQRIVARLFAGRDAAASSAARQCEQDVGVPGAVQRERLVQVEVSGA
jgi:GNAT superfamily N-acetyltransferase